MTDPRFPPVTAERGWGVIDLLPPPDLDRARDIVDAADLDQHHGFFASPAMAWGQVARDLDVAIRGLVAPHAAATFPVLRPFLGAITSKGAGSTTTIPFHQDWTYTDERRWRATFLWCPLVDTDADNGTLRLVSGSHRWSDDLRPSREREASADLQEELAELATTVPLHAGQAIAFDPATFHGSGGNPTDRARPAITLALVAPDAPLLHFHEDAGGTLEGYVVDQAFFTENPYRSRPAGYPTIVPHAPALTATTLRTAMAGGAAGPQSGTARLAAT